MNTDRRVRPSDDIIQKLKLQWLSHERSAKSIAEEYGVLSNSVRQWFRMERNGKVRACLWKDDPAGFDKTCMDVVARKIGVVSAAKLWHCSVVKVHENIIRLTGQPHRAKRKNARKSRGIPSDPQVDVTPHKHKMPADEKAKREQLKREVAQLLAQPLGAP